MTWITVKQNKLGTYCWHFFC